MINYSTIFVTQLANQLLTFLVRSTQNNVTNALLVNLGDETVTDIHLVNEILESNSGKLNAEAPQFIPQFQEKKDAHTVNGEKLFNFGFQF